MEDLRPYEAINIGITQINQRKLRKKKLYCPDGQYHNAVHLNDKKNHDVPLHFTIQNFVIY
jgi:negative regulator of genetic competence, sporulation and motility